MKTTPPCSRYTLIPLTTALLVNLPLGAQAQDARRGSSAAMLEEVIVTARKRAEESQSVPLSVSAFGEDQIEALKVRDLTNLAVGMPNVALDDVGTTRGTANFSIRGLGINSSIPSIDPTVGVVRDGVYLGVNNGIIFDTFDLASIEVLRGPQGTLFGRNVTGGAVLLNTRKPGDEFELRLRAAVDMGEEGGVNTYLMGSIGGPITDSWGARVTAYWNDDEGGFENQFTGDDFGEIEQTMIRPVVVWQPTDDLEMVFRYEYSETEGQGPAAQSHTNGFGVPGAFANFKRDSFDFSVDEEGFQDNETNFFAWETNWNVGFGDGTITNIFGWRDYDAESLSDIDAQPASMFHAPAWLKAEQFSNELRYTGFFANRAAVTAGVYWFQNEIEYHERRLLLGVATPTPDTYGLTQDGGGLYDVETMAAFASVDYDLNDSWILTLGGRYTREEKDAKIASLVFNVNSACNVVAPGPGEPSCDFDFVDDESWDTFSPKIGLLWEVNDDSRVYAHWTRGFRSGGYNLRNTAVDTVNFGPGPFDEEQVDNYEIGYKSEWGRGKFNAALFYNEIDDMQREVNLADPIAGVVQVIKNTADAEILGVEVDGTFAITDNLVLLASVGWLDPEYTEVRFDLNGDGVIDGADEDLDLPRAAEWTYSVGLTHDLDIGDWGYLSSRINYAYRDESAYTDNNRGFILEQEILDLGFDFYSAGGTWVFSLYGRNLLDEVKHGGDTQLPSILGPVPLGGTFSPLAKGRVYGAEITFNL